MAVGLGPWQLAWLAAAVFVVSAGYGALMPLLPAWLTPLVATGGQAEVARHVGLLSGLYAAGVLVGFGGGASHTTADVLGVRVPMATAVADVAAARRDYLDESGGRYVHVIADGDIYSSGDVARAIARIEQHRRAEP